MNILAFLVVLFIVVNIVQTILVLNYNLLLKGVILIGSIEALELPLIVYLIMKGESRIFTMVIIVELLQWLTIAYLSIKTDGYQKDEK